MYCGVRIWYINAWILCQWHCVLLVIFWYCIKSLIIRGLVKVIFIKYYYKILLHIAASCSLYRQVSFHVRSYFVIYIKSILKSVMHHVISSFCDRLVLWKTHMHTDKAFWAVHIYGTVPDIWTICAGASWAWNLVSWSKNHGLNTGRVHLGLHSTSICLLHAYTTNNRCCIRSTYCINVRYLLYWEMTLKHDNRSTMVHKKMLAIMHHHTT